MGRVIGAVFTLGLMFATTSSEAQEDLRIDQSKIYVSDPAGCDALKKKGFDGFVDLDFLALDFDQGIQSLEFLCDFFDVKSREGTTHLFVDAVCQRPGEIYPDILAIAPYAENRIQVVSAYDAALTSGLSDPASEVAAPGATLYTRCDNLSEITVD